MAIKRKDFQKLSSTVQEFLLKLPDEETSARLRDNLLHALHFLQLYYRVLQSRDKNNDPLQWTIDHSLSPLTPFREAPDKFEWDWINVDSPKVRQSLSKSSIENFRILPQIITAIKDGDLNTVRQLVKQDPQSVNNTDSFNRDCLTYAVQLDKMDILKFLLSNGANANNVATDSSTCLHRAVYKNNLDMVELLLEHKANINAQDSYNRAPLHWSVVTPTVDCLKVLLRYNPIIHIKDKDGMSPTMWACHLDHLEHFKLLSKIDNVNKKFTAINPAELEVDNDGRTWMHWSVRKNEPLACLNFLINHESVLLRDKEGKTCLHAAAEQGALQACKVIIETAGTKIINEKDTKKQTPLHLATLNGHARAIKILMDNGADINSRDITGASPLDYVTKRNLFFCNSIIEVCLRKSSNLSRQGASSSNSLASSLNGSDSNLTPAPPTTPKNTFTRSFQPAMLTKDLSGRPPRPINNLNNSLTLNGSLTSSDNFSNPNGDLSKTAPGSLNSNVNTNGFGIIPPSPPTGAKTRPNHRGGWNSAERIMSGSLRLSRASTRTSLASDDLDKYMSNSNSLADNYGGSLNNVEIMNPAMGPLGFNQSNLNTGHLMKPLAQPRNASTNSASNNGGGNMRIISGRSQDTVMSSSSYDMPTMSQAPPPIKPRKSSSVASLNNSNVEQQNSFYRSNHHQQNDPNKNNFQASNVHSNNNNNNNLNVEDISGDELSIASIKGEGFASDLSDNEIRNQNVNKRKSTKKSTMEHSFKRPTTPMDVRMIDQQQQQQQQQQQSNQPQKSLKQQQQQLNESNRGGLKYHQIGEQNVPSTRFNEWDPYGISKQQHLQQQFLLQQQQQQSLSERQKSPHKSKNAANSNFAHTFLNTDSSPRQTSGRSQTGSANVQNAKLQQMSPQNQQQFNSSGNQNEMSSSSNLDLMVSGQKLGGRKDLSPTNTPRESVQQQSPQHSQQNSANHRPFTRRLQPLEKLNAELIANSQPSQGSNQAVQNNQNNQGNEGQFLRQKTSRAVMGMGGKKLEPIKLPGSNMNSNSTSHVESVSTGPSLTEDNQNNNYNDEEPSISENTLSSDKQIINTVKVSKKKRFNQIRKKLNEPLVGNDEALKM